MKKGKDFRKRRNYTHKHYLEQGIRGGFHEDGEFDLRKGYSRKTKHKSKYEEEFFELEDNDQFVEETKEDKTEEGSS